MSVVRAAVRRLVTAVESSKVEPDVTVRRGDLELLLATFFEKREAALRATEVRA